MGSLGQATGQSLRVGREVEPTAVPQMQVEQEICRSDLVDPTDGSANDPRGHLIDQGLQEEDVHSGSAMGRLGETRLSRKGGREGKADLSRKTPSRRGRFQRYDNLCLRGPVSGHEGGGESRPGPFRRTGPEW